MPNDATAAPTFAGTDQQIAEAEREVQAALTAELPAPEVFHRMNKLAALCSTVEN